MEFLVFLMPLLVTLPIAAAAVIIAAMWYKSRTHSSELVQQVADLQTALDEVRASQAELQERMDFSERLLAQYRERAQLPPTP